MSQDGRYALSAEFKVQSDWYLTQSRNESKEHRVLLSYRFAFSGFSARNKKYPAVIEKRHAGIKTFLAEVAKSAEGTKFR